MKYQEALDELEGNAVQWKANKKWNKEHGFFIDDVGIDEMIAYSKLLQELVDKEIELESRKDKLVVGSEWECMLKTYGTVKIIDVHPLSERVTFRNMLFEHTEKIADFLLCFKPKGEYR